MKEVITINLAGKSYLIEKLGYKILDEYLDLAQKSLINNLDKEEIIKDLEQAIGEKFTLFIDQYKDTILIKDVETVLSEMGPIENIEGESDKKDSVNHNNIKRLYRSLDDAKIGGVCSGLGYYFGVDPLIFRILFIIFTFMGGGGILIYIILWFAIPEAKTSSEKLNMKGDKVTLSALKDMINDKVDEVKHNSDNWNINPNLLNLIIKLSKILAIIISILLFAFLFITLSLFTIALFRLPFNNEVIRFILEYDLISSYVGIIIFINFLFLGLVFIISGLNPLYKKSGVIAGRLKVIGIIISIIIIILSVTLLIIDTYSLNDYNFIIDENSVYIDLE